MKPKDPLEKYETAPVLPPRQRLKSAGAAFKTQPRSSSRWRWLVLAGLIVIALGLVLLGLIK